MTLRDYFRWRNVLIQTARTSAIYGTLCYFLPYYTALWAGVVIGTADFAASMATYYLIYGKDEKGGELPEARALALPAWESPTDTNRTTDPVGYMDEDDTQGYPRIWR